ncbi:MAG TPA: fumarylacetoacetate hydrolase family protein [Xanthobacteraceae bacterium]|nr:fumarylacetoacetate hydrolase family protein [Xanthobacteraceae bacterium]
MKIVNIETPDGVRMGIVEGDEVIDVSAFDPVLEAELGVFFKGGGQIDTLKRAAAGATSSARRKLADVKLALPVLSPGKIICLGLNYLDHVKEGKYKDDIPKFQSIFFRVPTSFVAPGAPLLRPKKSVQFDYEAELVVVIGKKAKHLTLESAPDCIAGYTCGMEGTVREYQRHTTQWGMGKNFDQTGSYGPWIVTVDALPRAGTGLKIESRLNGTIMQSSNTDHFMFPVAESLVYLTEGMTLEPGDLIFTGTPSGVGHARKPDPIWMKSGDEIEVEIEGVGLLRNRIQDE